MKYLFFDKEKGCALLRSANKNKNYPDIEIKNLEISVAIKTLNARVVKTEYLEDETVVIYAYTNLIKDGVEIFGRKVNLQFATRDETTIIGWPLILGSF